MARLRRLVVSLSFTAALAVQLSVPAQAEEPAVVKTLLDAYALNLNIRPTYKSIDTGSDGTITVNGFSFAYAEGMNFQYDVEKIALKGVTEMPGKGFEVADASYDGMTFKIGGQMVAAIPAITMRGLYVHAVPENPTAFEKAFASSSVAREATIPEVVILIGDKSLSVKNIHMTFEGDAWAYNGTQHMTLGELAVPDEILAMAGDQVPLKQLGYTSLSFSSDTTVKFDFTPQSLSFDMNLGLTGKDMGTIHIAANVAGIPMALVEAAQKGKENDDPAKLLALTNGITVSGLSVSFSDASLTNRLLDFFAAAQKMDRAQMIATAAATIQLSLTELKNQDFTNMVIAAVNAFLSAPGSISVDAAPAPIKVEQFMQASQDPAALISLLQVDVKANQ